MKRRYGLLWMLPLCVFCWSSSAMAQSPSVDFRQAANNDHPLPLGEVHWVNSILQRSNSVYYEGMSVPQRIMLVNVRSTSGNAHALTFDHLAGKNGKHAFDYLTSYDQAVAAAGAIAGPTVLFDLNECGTQIGPPASMQSTCTAIRAGMHTFNVDVPDAMGTLLTHNIGSSVLQYESTFGNRTIRLYGNAPITAAALTFTGYSNGTSPYAKYTLTWTSASTSILIEMAVHVAMGPDVASIASGIGYGNGLGASSISGAPYHVRLGQLDGSSLGNQDNQLMSSAVLPNMLCSASGPSPVCAGTQNVYSITAAAGTASYAWGLSNNNSNASIVSGSNGNSVLVHSGTTPGGFIVTASVSDGMQTVRCAVPVNVSGPSVTVASTSVSCVGGTATVTVSATGGVAPYTGTGTFTRSAGTHTFAVSDANGCTTTVSTTITEPAAALTATAVAAVSAPCTGGSTTAAVTVAATGGTPPYTGTGTFTRTPGTYSFTVTDANNCSTTTSVTIAAIQPLAAAASLTAPLGCNGGTAPVSVTATGGVPPYTGTGTFDRGAGTHSFTVTDANNCSTTTSITITEPPALTITAAGTPIICGGGTSTITVTASGGTPPLTGAGTFTRPAGTHTFTVTDANGCTSSASVTVTGPASLTATAQATPIDCSGSNSTVTITAAGGVAPYSGTGSFTRGAGTHTFTVTDANNCTADVSVTITAPPTFTASASATPLTGCGATSGTSTITVTASGGTPPYAGTGVFTRPVGTYTFTVTDARSCTAVTTVTIAAVSALGATATATPVDCGGTSTITVTAAGGTAPYAGTGTFTRPAGSYTFTVTDAANCTATTTVTVTAPPALAVMATGTPILCNGSPSTVTVTATGGTPPYVGAGTFQLGAGTHTITVTDARGCAASTSLTLLEPAAILPVANATPILCNGGSSTITVTATGGLPPYSGTGTFTRGAGTYTFTVTDALNCQATVSVAVTEPGTLQASASASPVQCGGGNSTITVTATGGTPPYSGTGTFTRPAGSHTFTVTDAHNCSTTTTVTVSAPPTFTVAATGTPVLCNGSPSTVTVTAMGGTPPYNGTGTYQVGAGTHTFTVTDANSCTASTVLSITEPTPVLPAANATPILCHGGTSTVTVTATGGTPPYSGTGTFTRSAGTHTFTVTDAHNCQAAVSVSVTEPAPLQASASATPVQCGGGNSTITVTASGGTAPYTGIGTFTRPAGSYTFTVTDAHGCTASAIVSISDPTQISVLAVPTLIQCSGDSATVTVTATGGIPPYAGIGIFRRPAGTFTFAVTDANNCTGSATITITDPPLLTIGATVAPILCHGDNATITITAAGGVPPYIGTGTFSHRAGTYTFYVTDGLGCTVDTTLTIVEPAPLLPIASSTPIDCHGGLSTVTVTATGGTPPYTGIGTFARGAGTHTFAVIDAFNCMADVSVNITEPDSLVIMISAPPMACNGDSALVTVTATGGTAPYSGTGTFRRGPGTHEFVVRDARGCADSASITLIEPPLLVISVSATPIFCHGDLSTITITATGGTPPYVGIGTVLRPAGTHTFSVTDDNGCTHDTTITLTQPPLLVPTAAATPITCNGTNSTITINATGGTPPYTGLGAFIRPAGSYIFTVTDAHGCSANVSVNVDQPGPITAAISATPILCNGDSSIVTITATGGTPPFSGTGTFVRRPGVHHFTVEDVFHCMTVVSITINEPPRLTASASATPILCNGDLSTVTVTAAGGVPPYNGTGVFLRAGGTHILTVTDANGCLAYDTLTIAEPPQLVVASTQTPILCNGSMSSGNISASGGTPPYAGTGPFTRPAGTHTFTVTDAHGCSSTLTLTITEPPTLTAFANATPILCYGGSSTVTVTATGGTLPYSGTGTFTVTAGTHQFIVSDANACLDTVVVVVEQPQPLVAVCSFDPQCINGQRTITASVIGGTPPYSYQWSPGNIGVQTFTVPCSYSGTYTLRVRDANWDPNDPNNGACETICVVTLAFFAPEDSTSQLASAKLVTREDADPGTPDNADATRNATDADASRLKSSTETPAPDYTLDQNYPNPFNPTTTIRYFLPEESHVRLTINNILGQTIAILVDAELPAGQHHVVWNATGPDGALVPSSRYIYRIHAISRVNGREFTSERLMLLLK